VNWEGETSRLIGFVKAFLAKISDFSPQQKQPQMPLAAGTHFA
jgi:hypothetical protein